MTDELTDQLTDPLTDPLTGDATGEPADSAPSRRRVLLRGGVIVASAAALGVFMLGFPAGILPALATVIYFLAPTETSRAASLAALVLLAVAAVATLAEGSLDPDDLALRYARDREIASTASAAAGGLLGIAVLTGAIIERSTVPAPRWQRPPRTRRERGSPRPRTALVVSLGLAALTRLLLAPAPFGPDGRQALDNLVNGIDYTTGLGDRVLVPPLAPLLATALPVGHGLLLLLIGLAVVFAVVELAMRLVARWPLDDGRPGPSLVVWTAGLVAALLPSLVTQRLPEALATLLVLLAALFADPARASGRRAAAAGGFLGLAVLAEPTTLLAAALVIAWIATGPARDRVAYAFLALAPLVLLCAPLLQWTLAELDTWWPRSPADAASGAGPVRAVAMAVDALAGIACVLAVAPGHRRDALVLRALPLVALVAGGFTGASSGIWGWAAGIVAAGAAVTVAHRWARRGAPDPQPDLGPEDVAAA